MNKALAAAMIAALTLSPLGATEYFTAKTGDDANPGTSKDKPFLSIQEGVDALKPGDVLIVGPGEYHESVRRDKIGDDAVDTVIRAEISGTVILRGDVAAPEFHRVEGREDVGVADLAADRVSAVNELDTLTILDPTVNAAELIFLSGACHYDKEAGKLTVSTSDGLPISEHCFTVSVIADHGFYLSDARRVVIEGLTVTGFKGLEERRSHDWSLSSTWGLFIGGAKNCVIRDCRAYLNGQGIGLNSLPEDKPREYGSNVIERCVAWGNASDFGVGDRGGLTLVQPRRDVIRDSLSCLNGHYGVNIRSSGPEKEMANRSVMENNIAWGNGFADFKIKSADGVHETVRCVGGCPSYRPTHCLFESSMGHEIPQDNIVLDSEKDLDLNAEFADPVNRDYRLQSTSRFRGALPDGTDTGPFPFRANVFYVRSDGLDAADGLSIATAWRTLARATRDLKPGDTVYLAEGVHAGDLALKTSGVDGQPISIRGRGEDPAVIAGTVSITDSIHLEFKRLNFRKRVRLEKAQNVGFDHCTFSGGGVGLSATRTTGLTITHCEFHGFSRAGIELEECLNADLRGNLYDNQNGFAVTAGGNDSVTYSDYNAYRNPSTAWRKEEKPVALDGMGHDKHSTDMRDAIALKGAGPWGRPVGPCRFRTPLKEMRLTKKPTVFATSATTANIEWRTSLPAACVVAWGETPECENERTYEVDGFGTFSLTGLKPGTAYYVRIKWLRLPREMAEEIKAEPVEIQMDPVPFITLASDSAPRTLHVAVDGDDNDSGLDRAHAWRTIQRAADAVRAGDTVRVAGGTYAETVRLRVTGAADAPITFASAPGEKVLLSGAGKKLNRGFVIEDKSHLRFDGFYFKDFNREPLHVNNWHVRLAGNFTLREGEDIRISRCFGDGRGGYSARFIVARRVRGLTIENCVVMDKMSGSMMFNNCPHVRMDHMVVCRPKIACFYMFNEAGEPAEMDNSILTDMLSKKAKENIALVCGRCFPMRNNGFFVREFPPEERHIFEKATAADLKEFIEDPVFTDPEFAGDPNPDGEGFPPDRLVDPHIDIDFNSFFATNPKLIERGIGLQPAAFADFHFNHAQQND